MNLRNLAPALLIVAACNSTPQAPGADAASSAAPPPAGPSVTAATQSAATAPPEAPKHKHTTVTLPAVAWTRTPNLADAPATVAVADASGMAVEMPVAEINRIDGEWQLDVREGPLTPSEERQFVRIMLNEPPASGAKPAAAFGRNRGLFQLLKPDGKGTISYNASNAWAIEFTSVEVKPYNKVEKGIQVVGKAKGRLIVMYEITGDGYKSSWVAGTFEARIRFWDDKTKPAAKK